MNSDLTAKVVPDNIPVSVPRAQATEVEPGKYLVSQPTVPPPLTGLHTWKKKADGCYEPVLELRSALVPLNEWNPRRYGCSRQTIHRLCIAGFVRADQPSPSTFVVDLHSYYEHLDQVRSEPLFWNEDRLARYSAARLLHNRGLGGRAQRVNKAGRELVLEAVKQILASPGTLNQTHHANAEQSAIRPVRQRKEDDHPELWPAPEISTLP